MPPTPCRYCNGAGRVQAGVRETVTPDGRTLLRREHRPCPHCDGEKTEEVVTPPSR